MADLRELIVSLGYKDVKTLLNSGNVVFSGPKPSESRIEAAFTKRFGFSSRITIIIIGATDLSAVVTDNPLQEIPDPSRFLVAFLKTPAHREQLLSIAKADWHPESFALGQRVAYMWCPDGILASRLAEAVNKILKDSVTV